MATSASWLTDSLHKAQHIRDITNFLGVRITEIFKLKIKVTCNDAAVLIIDTVLKKKRKFVEKAQMSFYLTWWRPVHRIEGNTLLVEAKSYLSQFKCVLERKADSGRAVIAQGDFDDEGATTAPLGSRAVGVGKGEQLVTWRCQVPALGIITRLMQPCLS